MSSLSGRHAIFLDRDGTVIEDVGYLADPSRIRLLDGAVDALAAFRRAGFALVVVSNQSGIGRGLVSPEQAEAVHSGFMEELRRAGVEPDDVRYCPHTPDDACACRKPSPRLVLDAADELGLDLRGSFMVGDKPTDVESGRNAGCRTVLLGTANGSTADHVAESWADAVAFILGAKR